MGNSMKIGGVSGGGQGIGITEDMAAAKNGGTADQKEQIKNGTLYAGNLNLGDDVIGQKRAEAQKQAMKLIRDQFEGDQGISDMMDGRRQHIEEMRQIRSEWREEVHEIDKEIDSLREDFGVAKDSQEQKDFELLVKQRKSRKMDTSIVLTEEERARLKEMGPMTAYQEAAMEMESGKDFWRDKMDEAEEAIKEDVAVIEGTKKALLGEKGMVDATVTAGNILDSASSEIKNLLIDEARDHIDEEEEEIKEEAEKKAEEEEKLETIEEKKQKEEKEREARILDNATDLTNQVMDLDAVKRSIDEILQKQKLLDEDIKGIEVDAKA